MASILARSRMTTLATSLVAGGLAVGIASRFFIQDVRADSHAPPKTFGGGPAFFSLALESSELVNHNTKKLRFKLPDQDAVSGLPVTSALLTSSWPKGSWTPVLRPYTPVTHPDEPGHIDFLVKKYPGGKSSTHLHSLKPGDSLFFVAAIKSYQWKANAFPHVTLIAGGAGITPIFQLTQGILQNPEDKTAITVVFGVNSDEDILLKKEFEQYERDFPGRFKAEYTVSHPVEGSPFHKGHVTKKLLEAVTPPPEGRETKVFVCGPPPMEKSLVGDSKTPGILQQLGYRKDQIYKF